MDNKPIAVGDLVWVSQACCAITPLTGLIFKVTAIGIPILQANCKFCNKSVPHPALWAKRDTGTDFIAPIAWLRRIPPLEELEQDSTTERSPAYVSL